MTAPVPAWRAVVVVVAVILAAAVVAAGLGAMLWWAYL